MTDDPSGAPAGAGAPPEGAADVFGTALPEIEAFAEMLEAEGELRGLIGPREIPRLWQRHLINSAVLSRYVDDGERLADIGSGAGFPGIVLALMRPQLEVHLVETMERRAIWLHHVVASLELGNVTVHRGRVEHIHHKRHFDVVTARAVAAIDKLARWTMPLLKADGRLVLLKGRRAAEELAAAKKVLNELGIVSSQVDEVMMPGSDDATYVVVCRRSPLR